MLLGILEANDGSIWFGSGWMECIVMMERPSRTLKVKRVRNNVYSRQFEKTRTISDGQGQQSNHLTFKIKLMKKTATLLTSLLLILFVSTETVAQLTS